MANCHTFGVFMRKTKLAPDIVKMIPTDTYLTGVKYLLNIC